MVINGRTNCKVSSTIILSMSLGQSDEQGGQLNEPPHVIHIIC